MYLILCWSFYLQDVLILEGRWFVKAVKSDKLNFYPFFISIVPLLEYHAVFTNYQKMGKKHTNLLTVYLFSLFIFEKAVHYEVITACIYSWVCKQNFKEWIPSDACRKQIGTFVLII